MICSKICAMEIGDIIRVEPEVGRLLAQAEAEDIRPDNVDYLYAEYKAGLSRLVGFGAPCAALSTPEAYAAAIAALCDVLNY